MKTIHHDIGRRVRALRRHLGMTQNMLSARTGIRQSRISMIERGDERLWPGYRARMAQALGIAESELEPTATTAVPTSTSTSTSTPTR